MKFQRIKNNKIKSEIALNFELGIIIGIFSNKIYLYFNNYYDNFFKKETKNNYFLLINTSEIFMKYLKKNLNKES